MPLISTCTYIYFHTYLVKQFKSSMLNKEISSYCHREVNAVYLNVCCCHDKRRSKSKLMGDTDDHKQTGSHKRLETDLLYMNMSWKQMAQAQKTHLCGRFLFIDNNAGSSLIAN